MESQNNNLHILTANPYDIFPYDVWLLILSNITKPIDINVTIRSCKVFRDIIPKSIRIVEKEIGVSQIPVEIAKSWSQLEQCHLRISLNNNDDYFSKLSKLQICSVVISENLLIDVWFSYWISSKHSDEEFYNISHTFYIEGETSDIRFRSRKGIITVNNLTPSLQEMVGALTKRFPLIVEVYDQICPFTVVRSIYPNVIGIRLTERQLMYCPLYILISCKNIKYIGIDPKIIIQKGSHGYLLEEIDTACEREVDIDIPIRVTDLPKLHECFPNMKSVLVLNCVNNILPKIPGIIVKGYDPVLSKYFE